MKKITLFALIALSFAISSCNKKGSLTVTAVKAASGQPVPYATMIVKTNPGGTQVNAAEASAQGVAVMENVQEGSYTIAAEKWDSVGAISGIATASVAKGKNTGVTVTLQ